MIAPKIKDYVAAGYPYIVVRTTETDLAVNDIAASCNLPCQVWDVLEGVRPRGKRGNGQNADILEAIARLREAPDSILFMINLHRFMESVEVVQALVNARDDLKAQGSHLIAVCPSFKIPPELEKSIVLIDYSLPDREALRNILTQICEAANIAAPSNVDEILDAATGLAAFEAENAFALSYAVTGTIDAAIIRDQKGQMIKKSASLEYAQYNSTFDNLIGLERLKRFARAAVHSPLGRGLLLLGHPGTGKSEFAKALGNETGLPTVFLDPGRLYGGLVGASEELTRSALATIDAMAPCILFIDEIEKGLSGVESSGKSDGGTSARVFGAILTWLQDHTSRVYVIATSNNVKKLPPEFLRAERWDGIFFVDLPGTHEREAIAAHYKKMFGVDGDLPDTAGYSGAEIKSLCRIAAMLNIPITEAGEFVVPLSRSMAAAIQELRSWAHENCLLADDTENTNKNIRRL